MDQVKKAIAIAKIIVIAEELKRKNTEISISNFRSTAQDKNINLEDISYGLVIRTLKENDYKFTKVFDKNKFAQRRIEMAELTRLGWTLQMIGDKYGITRQAVSLLLKKAAAHDNQIVVKGKTKRSNLSEKNVVLVKRSKKEINNCITCGKQFFTTGYKKKNCSKKCLEKSIEKRSGGDWSRKEFIELCCLGCGKQFKRTKYLHQITAKKKGNSKNNYCSRKCYYNKNAVPVQGC